MMLLDFIYMGEVNVMQEDLEAFLAAAIDLKVQGLTPSSPLHPSEDLGVSKDVQPLSSPTGQCPTPPIQITPDQLPSPVLSSPPSVSDLLSPITSKASGVESDHSKADSVVVKTEPCDVPDEVQGESESIPKLTDWSDLKSFVSRLANDQNGERVYSCKICHQKGAASYTLERHVESIHFPHTLKHICKFCKEKCATKHALDKHIYKMHKAEKSEKIVKAIEVMSPTRDGKLKESETEEASESCVKEEKLGEVFRDKEVNSWSDLKQYVIKMPDDESGLKVVQCSICQFKGRKSYDMTKHVEAYHFRGAVKHTCKLCNIDFDTKYALGYHTHNKHK